MALLASASLYFFLTELLHYAVNRVLPRSKLAHKYSNL